MAPSQLQQCFERFDIPEHATINDLDEQYGHYSLELHKNKQSTPAFVQEQQSILDDTYGTLLRHFIQRDCKTGQRQHRSNLNFDNIRQRRYEPGVMRPLPPRGESVGQEARDLRREQLLDVARINALFSGDVDSEDDDDEEEDMEDDNSGNDVDADKTMADDDDDYDDDDDEAGVAADEGDDSDDSDNVVVFGGRRTSGRRVEQDAELSKVFEIAEKESDIFIAPDNAVIVLNCLGVWGSGFAAELKLRFPAAFAVYAQFCRAASSPSSIAGRCLLIPPQEADCLTSGKRQPRRWIACIFTSAGYGNPCPLADNPGRDDKETIMMHTDSALLDLRSELTKQDNLERCRRPGEIYSPKINAGNFGVSWNHTKKLIAICFAGYPGTWNVALLPTEEH